VGIGGFGGGVDAFDRAKHERDIRTRAEDASNLRRILDQQELTAKILEL